MPVETPLLNLALDAIAVGTSGVFVVLTWRHRSEPAARPLLGMAVTFLLGALVHAVVVDLGPTRAVVRSLGLLDGPVELWYALELALVAVAAGFWAVFSFRYTGQFERMASIVGGVVGILVVAVLGLAFVALVAPVSYRPTEVTVAIALNLVAVVVISMGAVGIILLVRAAVLYEAFPLRQSVLFSAGVGVLFLGVTYAGIYRTTVAVPVLIAGATSLFSGVLFRYPLFETLPVTTIVGRDRVLDDMSEGIVVVDRDGRVRDLNPAAETLFDVDRTAVLGGPLSSVESTLPAPGSASTVSEPTRIETTDDRTLLVTMDRITDARGRTFGHLLVCRDVTDRRTREGRLTVLNQLLVGAVREQMNDVAEAAATLPDAADDRTAVADRIWTTSTALAQLVARTREVERALAPGDDRTASRTDLADTVPGVIADLTADERSLTIDRSGEPVVVETSEVLLTAVLQTLLTGAFGTTDVPAEVSVRRAADGPGEIRLTGETPAAAETARGPDHAHRSVADRSVEIARLAVEHAGGQVSVDDLNGARTVVIALPGATDHDDAVPSPETNGGESP